MRVLLLKTASTITTLILLVLLLLTTINTLGDRQPPSSYNEYTTNLLPLYGLTGRKKPCMDTAFWRKNTRVLAWVSGCSCHVVDQIAHDTIISTQTKVKYLQDTNGRNSRGGNLTVKKNSLPAKSEGSRRADACGGGTGVRGSTGDASPHADM